MMTKILTETFEINDCGECPYVTPNNLNEKWYCEKKGMKKIPRLWGAIPKWCPLPNKETD